MQSLGNMEILSENHKYLLVGVKGNTRRPLHVKYTQPDWFDIWDIKVGVGGFVALYTTRVSTEDKFLRRVEFAISICRIYPVLFSATVRSCIMLPYRWESKYISQYNISSAKEKRHFTGHSKPYSAGMKITDIFRPFTAGIRA